VEPFDKAHTLEQDLAHLARDVERLRDALVLFSLAVSDLQFESDFASRERISQVTDTLLERIKSG